MEKQIGELIEISFQMGYEAFPRLDCSPCLNDKFMQILPECKSEDELGYRIRIYLYKSYIKGWSAAHYDQVWKEKKIDTC